MTARRKDNSGNHTNSSPTPANCNSIVKIKAPRRTQALQEHTDELINILALLVDEDALDVLGLVCLGSCSKACRDAAAALLEKRAVFLLPTAVKQAASITAESVAKSKQQSARAALWLLQGAACGRFNARPLTAPTAAAQFLSICNVPQELALALLRTGLRVSYEQLMQAVKERTAGVEVWVPAKAQLAAIPTAWAKAVEAAVKADLPSWVRKLFKHTLDRELQAAAEPPTALPDMLLMACNMLLAEPKLITVQHVITYRPSINAAARLLSIISSKQEDSAAWRQWVAKQLDAELAGEIFLAAAARRNTDAMRLLDSIKPGVVPAAAVEAALIDAVQQHDTDWLAQLRQQPPAKACSTAVAVSLLLAALTQGYSKGVWELLALPGLQQRLTSADVSSLLLAALKGPAEVHWCCKTLLKLPIALNMQWDSFEAVLNAALDQHTTGVVNYLLPGLTKYLPALAKQMSFDYVRRVYQAAVQRHDDASLRMYVKLPAVCNATPGQLQQLMELSMDLFRPALFIQHRSVSSNGAAFNTLSSMPQAQELSHDMIRELLDAALNVTTQAPAAAPLVVNCWPLLCQLPQARRIDSGIITNWLGQCLNEARHPAAAALCSLLDQVAAQTAWGGLSSQEAEQLLARAAPIAKHGSVASLRSLCDMQCVKLVVETSAVVQLLHNALVFKGLRACRDPTAATKLLLQLPAAAAIPAADLAGLCNCVVEQCTDDEVAEKILQVLQDRGSLPGPDELTNLITACLHNRTAASAAACIQLLCNDPAAQQVTCSTVQQLLLEGAEAQQPQAMLAMLECLPAAAAGFSSDQAQQLLCATVNAAVQPMRSGEEVDQDGMADGWTEVVEAVAEAASGHGVEADTLLQLLKQAVQRGAAWCLQTLVEIRPLQQLQKSKMALLLQLAVQQQQHACLQALLRLPGAEASLYSVHMPPLLQASVQKDAHRTVGVLCGMQAAQLLQPQQVLALLTAAVRHGRSLQSVAPLCKLPAASNMPADATEDLLKDADDALKGIRKEQEQQLEKDIKRSARHMMKSTPYHTYRTYDGPKKGTALTPSQVARQTIAAATGAVGAEKRVPPRVQLCMRVISLLRDLQAAARMRDHHD